MTYLWLFVVSFRKSDIAALKGKHFYPREWFPMRWADLGMWVWPCLCFSPPLLSKNFLCMYLFMYVLMGYYYFYWALFCLCIPILYVAAVRWSASPCRGGAVCPSPVPPLHPWVSWLPGCRDFISGAQWLWGGTRVHFPLFPCHHWVCAAFLDHACIVAYLPAPDMLICLCWQNRDWGREPLGITHI